jgi:hypothetical protein
VSDDRGVGGDAFERLVPLLLGGARQLRELRRQALEPVDGAQRRRLTHFMVAGDRQSARERNQEDGDEQREPPLERERAEARHQADVGPGVTAANVSAAPAACKR